MKKINDGIYLVVDPMPGIRLTLPKIESALAGGVDAIQLWDHWNKTESPEVFIRGVSQIARDFNVPVLIHNHWSWLKNLPLDGVHFDDIPTDFQAMRKEIGRSFLAGITCGNDEKQIQWAIDNNLDYISFCSLFPSGTSNSCEIVRPDLITRTRQRTNLPIFVAGGIKFDNIAALPLGDIDGLAIVSGIMKAEDPGVAARTFKKIFSESKINPYENNIL